MKLFLKDAHTYNLQYKLVCNHLTSMKPKICTKKCHQVAPQKMHGGHLVSIYRI